MTKNAEGRRPGETAASAPAGEPLRRWSGDRTAAATSSRIVEGGDTRRGDDFDPPDDVIVPDDFRRHAVLTSAADIEPEPVTWLWVDAEGSGRIPAGSLGLGAGREGTGKSCASISFAAKLSRGELPGCCYGEPRSVIIAAREDSWKYTIVPRLIAAGADRSRIFRVEVSDPDLLGAVSLTLPLDNQLLEDAIKETRAAMVIFDPLISAISDRLDSHKNAEVRRALEPLAAMADRTQCAMHGLAHFSKGAGTDPSSLITASGAFKDVARYIFVYAEDRESGDKVVTQTKNSLGRSGLPSHAYRIISAIVPTSKGDADVGRFVMDGHSGQSVEDILIAAQRRPGTTREKIKVWLRSVIEDGPVATEDVKVLAESEGIAWRTIERARGDLNVVSRQIYRRWWMALPEHAGDLDDIQTASPGG